MKHLFCLFLQLALFTVFIYTSYCQQTQQINSEVKNIHEAVEKFSLKFFQSCVDFVDNESNVSKNILISPLSLWLLLVLIREGAFSNTKDELDNFLEIKNIYGFSNDFKDIQNNLTISRNDVEVLLGQFLFLNSNTNLNVFYEKLLEQDYGTKIEQIDFKQVKQAYDSITSQVQKATKGFIKRALNPLDIAQTNLIIISALYFKGQWTSPFNSSNTKTEPFYDESEQQIDTAEMMFQSGVFPYAPIKELESYVLELPYGEDKPLSMIFILPRKGVTLKNVLEILVNFDMEKMYEELRNSEIDYEDDEVEVHIPKFSFSNDYQFNLLLENMGVRDLFDKTRANLAMMSQDQIYLTRLLQKTKIEVNEEGTVAGAITSAQFINKATPPRFYANRPFLFLIVNKITKTILFTGQVKNPRLTK
uniref:Putative salivary serpin n=1 Tax=Corethrella appendiculata TaxID=1370023 RepID=U5EYE5_9DIPT